MVASLEARIRELEDVLKGEPSFAEVMERAVRAEKELAAWENGHKESDTAKRSVRAERERDRWKRDCEAALQVLSEHDLTLGQTVVMPLKLSTQMELVKAERDAALARAEAAESMLKQIGINDIVHWRTWREEAERLSDLLKAARVDP